VTDIKPDPFKRDQNLNKHMLKADNKLYEIFEVKMGQGRNEIIGVVFITKNGIVMNIVGGESHIGAVVLAIPRPSLKNKNIISSTSSVLTLLGHKDDIIAKPVAEYLAQHLNVPAVVITGIHIENANEEEIKQIINNSKKLVKKTLNILLNKKL